MYGVESIVHVNGYRVAVGSWRAKTYSEEASSMSDRAMVDVCCGGSKVSIADGRLVKWRLERALKRVVRHERRRLAEAARRSSAIEDLL